VSASPLQHDRAQQQGQNRSAYGSDVTTDEKPAVEKNNPRNGWRHGGHPLKSRLVKSEALLDSFSP